MPETLLQTLRMAFHAIKAGEGDQYIAARGQGQAMIVERLS